MCHNLIRIASVVSKASRSIHDDSNELSGPCDAGLQALLLKGASHPYTHITGMSLQTLIPYIAQDVSLASQLLPILQRCAITPYQASNIPKESSAILPPSFLSSTYEVCGASYDTFQNFRESILQNALEACYKDNPASFTASCTSAMEEFCADTNPGGVLQTSLHLEAALFCLKAVSDLALSSESTSRNIQDQHLERITTALATKPPSLTGNPLTLSQLCQFVHKVCLRNETEYYGYVNISSRPFPFLHFLLSLILS